MSVLSQLSKKVFEAASGGLGIHTLLEYQAEIASLRYTMGEELANAERAMLSDKEHADLHIIKNKLQLQAQMKGLSSTKADDLVMEREDTELKRLRAIESKAYHTRLKQALDTSGDMLTSIAQRVKRAENEEMTSRFQQGR